MTRPLFQPETRININTLWGALTAETLYRLGLRHVIISPGSRSTPLTYAFAMHPEIEAIPVLDERSASFLALGMARASRKPVALVCTSGTAAANYYPAVIEATEGEVPLLILSTDRPAEMRHCQSGQAIDQTGLFGSYPAFHAELAVPGNETGLFRHLRQMLIHAWERCIYPVSGAVHLNFPFRDPLPPLASPEGQLIDLSETELQALVDSVEPLMASCPGLAFQDAAKLMAVWKSFKSGLLIVGPVQCSNDRVFVESVAKLSEFLGWPVLAEGLSPVRNHQSQVPGLICHYDLILRNSVIAEKLQPGAVVSLGGLPISKVLRKWLTELDLPTWVIDAGVSNKDGIHRRTRFIRTDLENLMSQISCLRKDNQRTEHLASVKSEPANQCHEQLLQNHTSSVTTSGRNNGYFIKWRECDRKAEDSLTDSFESQKTLVESQMPWLLAKNLPEDTPVFVASSMPVRDMEYFWPKNDNHCRIFFNRGANGIDGTLSTAMGVAWASQKRTVLITGDLAFLHDTNGLLNARQLNCPLDVVLINNGGGGIFDNLPIAGFNPPFEKYFITPQNVDFEKLAAAHGVAHEKVFKLNTLQKLIADSNDAKGLRIIEVLTERKTNLKARRSIMKAIVNALDSLK